MTFLLHGLGRSVRLQPVLVRSRNKSAKERVRLQRLGLELRVELAAQEKGVAGDLDNLHVGRIRRGAGDAQAGSGEQRLVFPVELVTMTVPFTDLGCLIRISRD